MKKIRIAYWATTVLVALFMAFSAFTYLTNPVMEQGFQHLGFQGWFRVELATAKFIGVVLLLIPVAPRLKEWVYAGFTIVFISAFLAHTAAGDPVSARVAPIIALAFLAASYFLYHKWRKQVQQQAQPAGSVRTGLA